MKTLFTLILIVVFTNANAQFKASAKIEQYELPRISATTPMAQSKKEPITFAYTSGGKAMFAFLSATFVTLTVVFIVNLIKVSKG